MICTTLNKIRATNPCRDGWKKLLKGLGKTEADDDPVSFAFIVQNNGLEDALLCCESAPEHDAVWSEYTKLIAKQYKPPEATQTTDPWIEFMWLQTSMWAKEKDLDDRYLKKKFLQLVIA